MAVMCSSKTDTTIATFTNSSSDFIVESGVSDKDIIFKVNDGGSSTEVARFDNRCIII